MKRNLVAIHILLGVLAIASCGAPTPSLSNATEAVSVSPQEQRDINKTATGFFWPTGRDFASDKPQFLADSCDWSGNNGYKTSQYHIGWDIKARRAEQVYAIAGGTVELRSESSPGTDTAGWGEGNVGLFVRHKLVDGSEFLALYGHIQSDLVKGDEVKAGQSFAVIGPYPIGGDHLHFGIVPNTTIPPTDKSQRRGWGIMGCPASGPITDSNGFVDPYQWITTRAPYSGQVNPVPTTTSTATRTPPAPVPTPTKPIPTPTARPAIELLGTFPGLTHDVAVLGNYAYLAAGKDGLSVLDISNPAAIHKVAGFVDPVFTDQDMKYVAAAGNRAVVAAYPFVWAFDITDPVNLQLLGSYAAGGFTSGITMLEDQLYVFYWHEFNFFKQTSRLDISTPGSIVSTGQRVYFEVDELTFGEKITGDSTVANHMAIRGNYLYLTDSEEGLIVYELAHPLSNSRRVGSYKSLGKILGLSLEGNYAYLADGDGGLRIVDIGNPRAPIEVGFFASQDKANGVVVQGNTAYLAYSTGVVVLDVTDPKSIRPIASFDVKVENIAVANNLIFVASGVDGLVILRLTQSSNAPGSMVSTLTPPAVSPTTSPPVVSRPNGQAVVAFYRTDPPKIDGSLNDWLDLPNVAERATFGASQWRDANDLSAHYVLAWDEAHLYLAASVIDDVYVQTQHGEAIFKGDSLEILLDSDLAGDFNDLALGADDFQLGLSRGTLNGDTSEAWLWLPKNLSGTPNNVVAAVTSTNGGYIIEAQIPWVLFHVAPSVGQHLGFVFSISDNDTPGVAQQQSLVSSVSTRRLTDPTTWGTLELSR